MRHETFEEEEDVEEVHNNLAPKVCVGLRSFLQRFINSRRLKGMMIICWIKMVCCGSMSLGLSIYRGSSKDNIIKTGICSRKNCEESPPVTEGWFWL